MNGMDIPCEYFDMDPHELTTQQIDYELLLRNVPARGTARSKADQLRRLLKDEAEGRRNLSYLNFSPLESRYDLEHCSFLCHEMDEQMKEAHIDSRTLTTLWNRVVHLNGRLERIRPTNEQEEAEQCRLLFLARSVKFCIAQRRNPHFYDEIFHPTTTSAIIDTAHSVRQPSRTLGEIEDELRQQAALAANIAMAPNVTQATGTDNVSQMQSSGANWRPPLSSSSRKNSARNSTDTRAHIAAMSVHQPAATQATIPQVIVQDCSDDEPIVERQRTERDLYPPNFFSTTTWNEIGQLPIQDTFSFATPTHLTFHDDPPRRTNRSQATVNNSVQMEVEGPPMTKPLNVNNTQPRQDDGGARPKTSEYHNNRLLVDTQMGYATLSRPSVVYTVASTTSAQLANAQGSNQNSRVQTHVTYTLPQHAPIMSHPPQLTTPMQLTPSFTYTKFGNTTTISFPDSC